MYINGGTYICNGDSGAPAVYSTAQISVIGATLTSNRSKAVIIEGKNSVGLVNCTVSGNDHTSKSGSVLANVQLYQSQSGDAAEGTSEFFMYGGLMTCNSGTMFYCTNTSSEITLSGVQFTNNASDDFLIVSAGRWGKDGKNGAEVILYTEEQEINGNITVDEISSLDMTLSEESVFVGSITGGGEVSVTLEGGSTWTLTGDSYISSFNGDLEDVVTDGYKLYINGDRIK